MPPDKASHAEGEQEGLRIARDLSLGGLVVALGITIPVLFHAFGSGPIFLPMHIPVMAGAMLLPAGIAATVGAVTPLASAALTGMPPIAPPIAIMMALELAAIAAAASLLRRKMALSPLLATLGAIAVGRAVYAMELFALAPAVGVHLPAAAAGAVALVRSWPGLALQVLIVPAAVTAAERGMRR